MNLTVHGTRTGSPRRRKDVKQWKRETAGGVTSGRVFGAGSIRAKTRLPHNARYHPPLLGFGCRPPMLAAFAIVFMKHAFADEDMLGPKETGDPAMRAGGLL